MKTIYKDKNLVISGDETYNEIGKEADLSDKLFILSVDCALRFAGNLKDRKDKKEMLLGMIDSRIKTLNGLREIYENYR